MTLLDGFGIFGVLLVLVAYAGATTGKLDPKFPPALMMNLIGSCLILWSMTETFNLSAFVMETTWAMVALHGLIRPLFARKR